LIHIIVVLPDLMHLFFSLDLLDHRANDPFYRPHGVPHFTDVSLWNE
jgi:hypothetical protein